MLEKFIKIFPKIFRSFLGHIMFYKKLHKNLYKISISITKFLQIDITFSSIENYAEALRFYRKAFVGFVVISW